MSRRSLPIVDLTAADDPHARDDIAAQLDRACRDFGFFYLIGHRVPTSHVEALMRLSKQFFALPLEEKRAIHMSHGGRAWRGWFQLGEELTSGTPDRKEGVYFGTELDDADHRVRARLPLHGRNLFPPLTGFREAFLQYMGELTALGHELLALLARGLGLDESYFRERYTRDPTLLFRIFHYPRTQATQAKLGVGEHTDYGFLTLLKQDNVGGLQVRHRSEWLDVPDVPNSFVCNVGDMLERVTRGRYLSALHRVHSSTLHDRVSMALFFDPSFDATLAPIDGLIAAADQPHTHVRWDEVDPHTANGTYGDYLVNKVSKVFPVLRDEALD